jgi:hypothetical protein
MSPVSLLQQVGFHACVGHGAREAHDLCHVAEPQALPLNDDTLLEELCLNETVEVKVTALEQSVLLAMWCVQFVA